MEATEARAKAGWYPHKSMPGMLRYWNGDEWVEGVLPRRAPAAVRKPEAPAGWIVLGFIVALIGGALTAVSDDVGLGFIGLVVLGVGSIFVSAGTIAAGVRLGMQWADYQRWERENLN